MAAEKTIAEDYIPLDTEEDSSDDPNYALEALKFGATKVAPTMAKAAVKAAPYAAKAAAAVAKGVGTVAYNIATSDGTAATVTRSALKKGTELVADATLKTFKAAATDDGLVGEAAREVIVKPLLKETGKFAAKAIAANVIPGGALAVSAIETGANFTPAIVRGELKQAVKEEGVKSVCKTLFPLVGMCLGGPLGAVIGYATATAMSHGGVNRKLEEDEKPLNRLRGWFGAKKDTDAKGGKRINKRKKSSLEMKRRMAYVRSFIRRK